MPRLAGWQLVAVVVVAFGVTGWLGVAGTLPGEAVAGIISGLTGALLPSGSSLMSRPARRADDPTTTDDGGRP